MATKEAGTKKSNTDEIEHMDSDRLMKDWILYNIEQSSETENLVPVLYANQDKVVKKSELQTREVT